MGDIRKRNPVMFWVAFMISYLAILPALTTVWQLAIIPPVIGGMFIKKKASIAWWAGFLGVLFGWFTFLFASMVSQPVLALVDMLMAVIVGSSGLGIVAVLLTLVIGGCIGGFGGIIGFAIAKILIPEESA